MTHRAPARPLPLPAWGLACCLALLGPADAGADTAPLLEQGVAVPMRDGAVLRADIWRPAGAGPFPALVCRTPYGKDTDKDELRFARRAVARGYAVVIQDVRGRYSSGGEFVPHQNEGRDGFDTIEWVARQDWCDGAVGTFGLSYPGSAQWLAALEQPPHLRAMAPAMTYASLRQAVYPGGAFDLDWLRWALVAMAPDQRARLNLPGPRTGREALADWKRRGPTQLQGHLPLLSLPALDAATAFYSDWLRHPQDDAWWNYGDLHGRYHLVSAAVLNLSGWYDDSFSVAGAIANHLGLLAARTGQADKRSMLVLGPWSHGINAVTGDVHYGTRDFGPTAHLDYDGLVLDFMDHHLRGLNTLAGASPVRYFIMGANQWREAATWPPREAKPYAVHLGPPAQPQGHGALSHAAPAPGAPASTFTADPAHPVREVPGSDLGPVDLRALTPQDDLLFFETPPLEGNMAVAGHVRAEIFISTDAPDLDLYVKLLDVAADGTAYSLMDAGAEVLRASLRPDARAGERGLGRKKRLLEPGRIHRLDLDTLLTANTFRKAHRIRVALCASWFPGMSRNLQTGESEAASAVMRPARITVHHDAEHASRLILPVLP